MTNPETFTRSVPFELRDISDGLTLTGYAAVFNSPTSIQERGQSFTEIIAPGAFARAINAADHIVMQWNHGQDPAIGQTPVGAIQQLREDDHGLFVEAKLNAAEHFAGVRQAIADGAIQGMSFRFHVPDGGDTWDRSGETPVRTITNAYLHELGPVAFPAYKTTSVAVRSLCRLLDDDDKAELANELRADSARPEEGTPNEQDARPEKGTRPRTTTQRRAIVALANIQGEFDG